MTEEKKQYPPMTDDSRMFFGKHKGKPMKQVPADYLLWVREQEWITKFEDLFTYIELNLEHLKVKAEIERDMKRTD